MASLPSSVSTPTTHLRVSSRLAEDALNPTVHVTDKGVKQHESQY